MKLEHLKYYLSLNKKDLDKLIMKLYLITDGLNEDYPKHKEWFFTSFLPGVKKNESNIIFVREHKNKENIIAVAFLKKSPNLKKICTLFVQEEYRKKGLGTKIIEESLQWLDTRNPFFTITSYKLKTFESIIKKYDWKLTQSIDNLYNNKHKELCYNGKVLEEKMTR